MFTRLPLTGRNLDHEILKPDAAFAAHSLAEVYASLTRMPGKQRLTAANELLFLKTLQERLTIVALDAAEYATGIKRLAATGIVGGTIYAGILALRIEGRFGYDLCLEPAPFSDARTRSHDASPHTMKSGCEMRAI